MREARDLLSAARSLQERREPFVTATVVKVQGSSYRRPGARLLATAHGRVAGTVSGGCLERELVRTALWHTRRGPVVRRFDSTDPDEPALGCGGVVDVLLERSDDGESELFDFVSKVVAAEARAVIATAFRSSDRAIPVGARAWAASSAVGSALVKSSNRELARCVFPEGSIATGAVEDPTPGPRVESREVGTKDGVVEYLVELVVPPPHLFVLGSGLDAAAVVATAQRLGWAVTVWDASPSFETGARFAGTNAVLTSDLSAIGGRIDASDTPLVVIMGHHRTRDQLALRAALDSRAFYIGVLGPRHRTASLTTALPGALDDPRVHAPVGLDVGAETPEEIALSIVAEMLGCLRGGSYTSLRQRAMIHRSGT